VTTRTQTKLPDGTIQEVVSTPGAAPLVFLNGVIQNAADYTVNANLVIEFHKKKNLPWTKWFAWRPVKDVHGDWHWWEHVYRKIGNTYVDDMDWTWYYYGTIFDVLEDTND
jgi:hypothetical protein